MAEFHTVARVGEIRDGQGRAFLVNGRMVAVFNIGGEYRAMLDSCPHMGASLAAGYVEEGAVTCPWHAWRFCVDDGLWLDNPRSSLRTPTFPVEVVGEEVRVSVADLDHQGCPSGTPQPS